MNMDAFKQAFKAEMDGAVFEALVERYVWANSTGFGQDESLRPLAEKWAADIIAKGDEHTMEVLAALYPEENSG